MKTSFAIYLSFFCLLILFGSVSCKKDKLQHTSSNGIVVDATTQQALPGALVKLITQKRQFLGYGGYSLVDSMRTNAEGKFHFNFQADDDFTYSLQAKSKRYIDQGTLTGLTNGKKNNYNLVLQPEAFLKINIVNVPPLDTLQYFSMVVTTLFPSPPLHRLCSLVQKLFQAKFGGILKIE